mgnify:CR=1 FL=1
MSIATWAFLAIASGFAGFVDAVAGGQLQRLAPGSQLLVATGPSDLPVVVSRD